jgi:uncharacterized membrane protein
MRTIVGLFDTIAQAKDAVADLENAGFAADNISLLVSEQAVHIDPTPYERNKTRENEAAIDAEAGAAIGSIAGLLVGLGVFVIPGFGPVAAVGWLVSTLTGAGAGAIAGGLIGTLIHVGAAEGEARRYAAAIEQGGVLLLVIADPNDFDRAFAIMRGAGARNIGEREEPEEAERPNATQLTEPNENAPEHTPRRGSAHDTSFAGEQSADSRPRTRSR